MRMTDELRERLHAAIDREEWDLPGETTYRDEAKAHVDAVPTGTVLAPEASEYDDGEQPLSDLAHTWETVSYFGLENVAGNWQPNHDPSDDPNNHDDYDWEDR